MSRGKRFSEQELEFIKVHSLDMSIGEIAEKLGRNYWAIQRIMQKKNGLMKNHVFSPDDDFLIKNLYQKYSAKFIATKLGVDEVAVYNRAKKLGLKKYKR